MNGHVAKKASAKSRTGLMYYPVVELDADPVTGKRARRWHPGHVLKADAQEALRKLQDDADKGTYVAPVKETFGEYLEVAPPPSGRQSGPTRTSPTARPSSCT